MNEINEKYKVFVYFVHFVFFVISLHSISAKSWWRSNFGTLIAIKSFGLSGIHPAFDPSKGER